MSVTKGSRHVRVSIDTGGTFTDIVAIDEISGHVYTTKTPSTPGDPSQALLEGIRKIAERNGFSTSEVSTVVHGTTTATNAVLQRDFGRLGLIVTKGFQTFSRSLASPFLTAMGIRISGSSQSGRSP